MGINFTMSELDERDYLRKLITAAEEGQRKFMLAETAEGRFWYIQFRDEIVRLKKEYSALIDRAALRDKKERLESAYRI